MRRLFLLCSLGFVGCISVWAAEPPGGLLINEVHTDPTGSDTGKEYIELINTSSSPLHVGGWEIDPDQLPYFVIPSGTIVPSGETLLLQLRQQGTSTGTTLYTGTQFGSTNMGNTKGSVALFRPGGRDAAHLEDFLQWGGGNQTHSASAAETGLFIATEFIPVVPEGLSYTRICPDALCFEGQDPSPGSTPGPPHTSTGEIIEPTLPPPQLQLQYVAMNNTMGTADDLGILVVDDGNGGQGQTLGQEMLRVDTQTFVLEGLHVRSGDTLHVSFGSQETRAVQAAQYLRWTALSGLVATTEQVFLYDAKGDIADGVCWFKDPIAQSELPDMELIQANLWVGNCISSATLAQGTIFYRQASIPIATSWAVVQPNSEEPEIPEESEESEESEPPCDSSSRIRISEVYPNPPNADSGREWIELQNTATEEVSLCGLFLDDEEGGSRPYDLSGVRIAPGSFLLVPDSQSGLALGNTADAVRLLNSLGTVLEEVSYEDAPSGKSYSSI